MRIKVKLFALYREKAGFSEASMELQEGALVQDAMGELLKRAPALGEVLDKAFVAVNRRYARPDSQLKDGDELAVFPPVSGG